MWYGYALQWILSTGEWCKTLLHGLVAVKVRTLEIVFTRVSCLTYPS